MQHLEATLAFQILPQPHVCRSVREGVAAFATERDVPREDLEHFQTALGEALANAIEHGGSHAPIVIEIRLTGDLLVATVTDLGVGFVPSDLAGAELGGISERGRGLPIMRRCSDVFTVESRPGTGTTVMVGRYLRDACRGAA